VFRPVGLGQVWDDPFILGYPKDERHPFGCPSQHVPSTEFYSARKRAGVLRSYSASTITVLLLTSTTPPLTGKDNSVALDSV